MLNQTNIAPLSGAASLSDGPTLREQILEISRQNRIAPLSAWFSTQLDTQIEEGYYLTPEKLAQVSEKLIEQLVAYRVDAAVSTVVLGMSGGVDSALTAALFKKAGWKVIGVTLPIHQNPEETERGVEAIRALGLDQHVHVDLSTAYDQMLAQVGDEELLVAGEVSKAVRVRRGNMRARLRMVTLYNLAAKNGGLVASTDNLSELIGSFWTLHGDVGDFSPIQAMNKSWEVPFLARLNGVPERTVCATPTDGLGIDAGDEAQLGCSYLEWDLMYRAMTKTVIMGMGREDLAAKLEVTGADRVKFDAVVNRMGAGWFKRYNPMKLPHPMDDRYGALVAVDKALFVPASFRAIV